MTAFYSGTTLNSDKKPNAADHPALFLTQNIRNEIASRRVAGIAVQDVSLVLALFTTSESSRLFRTDAKTGVLFLLDSRSDVCVLSYTGKQHANAVTLFSANGSPIKTFGTKLMSVDLNLRRNFTWPFIQAKVTNRIIETDFFKHHGLLIDLEMRVSLSTHGIIVPAPGTAVTTIAGDSGYHDLLRQFPDITRPYPTPQPGDRVKHITVHVIRTTGQPVFAKARRLNPQQLAIAEK